MSKQLIPNFGQAILKTEEEGEKMFGSIIVPDVGNAAGKIATIVEIEKIYNFNTGEFLDSKFQKGDVVVFSPLSGQKVILEGEDYLAVPISDLVAAIREIN